MSATREQAQSVYSMQSQKNYLTVLLALLALRAIIGFHFFNEGITKIQSGKFSCEPFLRQAKGPFAPFYSELLDDHDGHIRLCIKPMSDDPLEESGPPQIDASRTVGIWEDFVDRARSHFSMDESQSRQADAILKQSVDYLESFLDDNRSEILAWAGSASRLDGFDRDGEFRTAAAREVASLYGQVSAIRGDRSKSAAAWFNSIESTWDELEGRINYLAGLNASDGDTRYLEISRPYQMPDSPQTLINRWLPWFDLIVGVLLIVGLFTRLASLAGTGLLLGVVMTQPFWVAGTENTFYQWIEIGGLLVLCATAAGQFGGLDYFLGRRQPAVQDEES